MVVYVVTTNPIIATGPASGKPWANGVTAPARWLSNKRWRTDRGRGGQRGFLPPCLPKKVEFSSAVWPDLNRLLNTSQQGLEDVANCSAIAAAICRQTIECHAGHLRPN